MSRSMSASKVIVLVSLALSLAAAPSSAQVVSLKTVPLAAGEQFLFLPSTTLGMGAVSIAVDDEALDPFVNPAKGVAISTPSFFGSLNSYSVSNRNGGATTLPLGMSLRSDDWFGSAVAAVQTLNLGFVGRIRSLPVDPTSTAVLPPADGLDDQSSMNKYVQAGLGRSFADGRYAVGVSAMLADLNGTDGVEQLFANAWTIEEWGHAMDYRLGFVAELPGARRVDAVLVYTKTDMRHEVTSVEWTLTDSINWLWTPEVEDEDNLDRSSTWGAHVGYVQPLGETSWRIGGILTANRKQHPKIPTYDLERVELRERAPIPRDPGNSWAFNIGAGLAYEEGPTTFGVDMVYEPASSHTWAEAEADVTASDGTLIPLGGRTVENWFDFSNAIMRIGASHRVDDATFQLGVRMRAYDYHLDQLNHVEIADVSQTEQWTEWSPTWGVRLSKSSVEVSYTGLATAANRFPSLSFGGRDVLNPGAIQDADLLAPPPGRLSVPDESVVTHRITVSVPIR